MELGTNMNMQVRVKQSDSETPSKFRKIDTYMTLAVILTLNVGPSESRVLLRTDSGSTCTIIFSDLSF